MRNKQVSKYLIKLSDTAEDDLNNIADNITEEFSSPEVAIKIIVSLESTLKKRLDTFPHAYLVHSYLESLGIEYRRTVVGNFTAFYKIDEINMHVIINYIIYSKRDMSKIVLDARD